MFQYCSVCNQSWRKEEGGVQYKTGHQITNTDPPALCPVHQERHDREYGAKRPLFYCSGRPTGSSRERGRAEKKRKAESFREPFK